MAHILIAENNASVSRFLQASLKKAGHAVRIVDNSLDAWRAIGNGGFDAILINAVMPGLDSFVLAQKALMENPHMQIVFLTGFAAVAMDGAATPSYAPAPFTSRPFHLKNIASRLGALMAGAFWEAAAEQTAGTVIYADFAGKA